MLYSISKTFTMDTGPFRSSFDCCEYSALFQRWRANKEEMAEKEHEHYQTPLFDPTDLQRLASFASLPKLEHVDNSTLLLLLQMRRQQERLLAQLGQVEQEIIDNLRAESNRSMSFTNSSHFFDFRDKGILVTSQLDVEEIPASELNEAIIGVSSQFPQTKPNCSLPRTVQEPKVVETENETGDRSPKLFLPDQLPQTGTVSAPYCFSIPVALPNDRKMLSKYQVLVRASLEFCVATADDTSMSQQGRRHRLRIGQVGVRCIHCSHIRPALRSKGAANYPRSINSLYQAAQNVATSHFLSGPEKHCPSFPAALRRELLQAKTQNTTSLVGPPYWSKECRKMGMVERDGAVWWSSKVASSSA